MIIILSRFGQTRKSDLHKTSCNRDSCKIFNEYDKIDEKYRYLVYLLFS